MQQENINNAIKNNIQYICAETLADSLDLVDNLSAKNGGTEIEIGDKIKTSIQLDKI